MKTRKKRSIIWSLENEEFAALCKNKNSLAEILRHFNLHVGAGNYKTLKKRICQESIDISHITLGLNSNKGRLFLKERRTEEQVLKNIFVENSITKGTTLKRYIRRFNFLIFKCSCGQGEEWNGKKLVLQLDHINGRSSDNRLQNLRLLCPNCHSQTSTFSGKNIGPRRGT